MKIGELAKQIGLSTDTLRYYEKEGLISPSTRHANGYRQYNQDTFQQLQFITHAKTVGFSLKECRQLLTIFKTRDAHTCADVKILAETKLEQIQEQMLALQNMHSTLKQIADACCGGSDSAINCSILNTFEQGKTHQERH